MKVTMREVAQLADVSVATVSMVINHKDERISKKTRDKVYEAIAELNYEPNRFAQMLKTGTSHLMALLVPDLANDFYAQIAQEAMIEARKQGFFLTFIGLPSTEEEKDSLRRIIGNGEFAGILMVSREFDEVLLEDIFKREVPCIILDESIDEEMNFSLVAGDNYTGGRLVAEHFVKMGHRKLGCITGPKDTPNSMNRLKGFVDELSKHSITLEKDHILIGDYTLEGGYHCGKELMSKDVTGIFAFNDLTAIGCMKAALERGKKIPEDLSIIGYDFISMANYTHPKLTSIDQNPREIAHQAIEALIKLIKKETIEKISLIEPSLILGETVLDLNKNRSAQ